MGTLKVSIGQFLIEAAALTTLAALIALIISAALIRLLGSAHSGILSVKRRASADQPTKPLLLSEGAGTIDHGGSSNDS